MGVVVFCLVLAVCLVAVDRMFHSLAVSARAANPEEADEYLRRLSLCETAIRAWLSAPLAGIGVGGFAWAQYTIPRPWAGSIAMPPAFNAHDILLQLLAETGLIGAGLFVAALVLWLRAAARRTETGPTPWRTWAVGMVSVELVHSLFEFPLWNANFLGVAALLMGFCDPRLHRMTSGLISRGLALGAAGIGAVILFTTLHAELALLYWGTMPPELRSDPVLRQMQEQAMSRVKRSLLAPYGDVITALALPVARDNAEARIAFLERPMHFWPTAALVQKQILLLAMTGSNDRALALLADLARLEPKHLPRLNGELQRIPPADVPADSPVRQRLRELAGRQQR